MYVPYIIKLINHYAILFSNFCYFFMFIKIQLFLIKNLIFDLIVFINKTFSKNIEKYFRIQDMQNEG